MKSRALSDAFLKEMIIGRHRDITATVRADSDLMLCLRGDYVTVYYKSMQILRINENGTYYIDGEYNAPNPNDVTDWATYFRDAKCAIDAHNTSEKLEKEIQQQIARENNSCGISNGTDYFVFDIEYAQPDGDFRFDALAVHWPRNHRKSGNDLQLAIIEVKVGESAIGGKSGMCKHYSDTARFIVELGNNPELSNAFLRDTEKVIQQLRCMGMWKTDNPHPITMSLSHPQLIFAMANFNRNSTALAEPLSQIIQEHTDVSKFDVLFASSSFMGYGLYNDCMLTLDWVAQMIKEK